MLQNLEKEIDDVDAKIGDRWRLLDRFVVLYVFCSLLLYFNMFKTIMDLLWDLASLLLVTNNLICCE